MAEYFSRLFAAVGLAGIAGFLHGIEPSIPLLVDTPVLGFELSPVGIGPILSLVSVVSTAVTIGLFIAGYWWANRASVPAAYGRFALALFLAAFVGYSVGFFPLFILLSEQTVVSKLGLFVAHAISLLAVPFPALAGGAIAQYRSATRPI